MIKWTTSLFACLLLMSCASSNSFQKFYNDEKDNASIALAFPKYMAMIAVPQEEKKEIKPFVKGMKKVRVLYDERDGDQLINSFINFANDKNYSPYLIVKDSGNDINLFAKQEGDFIREIVLDLKTEDERVIVALMGKMDMKTFQSALAEAKRKK